MDITLRPNGPHSDEYTEEVADAFDETVRVLAYAAASPYGLPYPGTAYRMLGSLYSGVGKMDEVLDRTGARLRELQAGGLLNSRGGAHDGRPDEAARAFSAAMDDARTAAAALYKALTVAQAAIAGVGMAVVEADDDDV